MSDTDIHKRHATKESAKDFSVQVEHIYLEPKEMTGWEKFVDSFKPLPQSEKGAKPQKAMSKLHMRMIALCTGLGTGLLVGAGSKLRSGGPLFLLVAYFIVGYVMVVPTVNSLGELTVAYPSLNGGFQNYYTKFIDESLGFSLGWNYASQWLIVISLELVTASMTIKFWTESVNEDIWVTIFLFIIITINLFGASGYGRAETVMNSLKATMLTGFVIFGLCIDLGAGPKGFIGGRYWRDPGYLPEEAFKGLCGVFVTSSFSIGGFEFVSVAAADTENPRQALPAACKLILWRVTVLYLGSLLFVGLLVPYNSDMLMGAAGSATHASPYVIAAESNGVRVLPHIINAVILVSVTSVATASMYSTPRLMVSLAEQGFAPKWMGYIDKTGRPLFGWIFTIFTSFFAYIAVYKHQETVFNWMLSISGLSFILIWLFICICHLRFRAVLEHRGIPLDTLGFVSPYGKVGSYLSITINLLMLIAQFYVSLFPKGSKGKPNANSFFQNYLGVPVFLFFWAAHKLWTRNWKLFKRVDEIDLDKDRQIYDPEVMELENLEAAQRFQNAPFWKKALIVLFD
ncbi:amino acid transporter [Scheffersomyces spartinae]|uniref:Amino acid transporter n=1 Tax=Scheffersomyces spartinae TaxID=45513 RepID=A0A9P7V5T9_9ASCO|nr:amino acid transporter [Scheffersomyces spartinae]KAG7191916.1 amino acid transporter [Scheffersomyces spartinae]